VKKEIRTKREIAHDVLGKLLTGRTRITIAEAVEATAKAGVSRRTTARAARELGLQEIHNGPYGAFWERAS
jgi:hypothetical protein